MRTQTSIFKDALSLAIGALLLGSTHRTAQAELHLLDPAKPQYGKSYGDWGGVWWQWASGLPAQGNPTADGTGADAAKGQNGNVWFLAGSTSSGKITRKIEVPQGKAIFFPILNYVAISTEPTDPTQLDAILQLIEPMHVSGLNCTLDGVEVSGFDKLYARSGLFDVTLPEGNLFGIGAGTFGPSAAVGYYVMLAPPSPGTHTIHFGGKIEPDVLTLDVAYEITVVANADAQLHVLDPSKTEFGKTAGDWGAAWWQWASGIPAQGNPTADLTGADALKGQSGGVFFLAGATSSTQVERKVEIPQGKALFFPILNSIWISTDPGDPTTLEGILAKIEPMDVSGLNCTVDGVALDNFAQFYARSGLFNVTMPDGNIFGIGAGTYGPSATVGYYVMLAPPSLGTHTIHFGGKINPDVLTLDVTYEITVTARKPDLSRLVAVGDSVLAGFRNGGLVEVSQSTSIPALIAQQSRVSFPQPLIAWPGIPNVLELKSAGPPPVITPVPGTSSGRVDIAVQSQNLAVPAQTVKDALTKRPDFPVDSMTDLILGLPGLLQGVSKTQIELAEALKPTTVVVWIGNNDALNAVIAGTPDVLTPEAEFKQSYSELLDRLAATGATLLVATIPDTAAIPYVEPVRVVAFLLGVPDAVLAGALGVSVEDSVNLDALPDIIGILTGQRAGPLAANFVLTQSELAAIRAATDKFNAIIQAEAHDKGGLLVDTHAYLNSLIVNGADIPHRHITTQYLGGIFSLDGIHPSTEGAMITANQFISVLNQAGAQIPPIVWLDSRREGNDLVLSWPVTSPGYSLKSSGGAGVALKADFSSVLTRFEKNTVRIPVSGTGGGVFSLSAAGN